MRRRPAARDGCGAARWVRRTESGPRKLEQRIEVMMVGGMQRGDVALPEGAGVSETGSSSRRPFPFGNGWIISTKR